MYGFKPRHAQGKPVQNLAGGGIVHSLTGMLGMRDKTPEEMRAADAKAQARNKEAAARVAERNKPAEQPAAPAAKAISEYSGMSAMQRREKEQVLADGGAVKPRGFKAGGMIRGPGTGTSDSIETEKLPGTFIMPADSTQAIGPEALEKMGEKMPVRLSNGEFELPPEQVQALGEAVLTVMRNATHQPAAGQEAPTGKGFTPHQFFAGGGTVKDEEQQRLANQTAMYVRGAQEAAANRPPEPAAPAQPASTSGGLNAPWWSGEYATAARLSDKSGLELEQQRAAAATPSQAPANDPLKRIINTGTLSMPQAVTKPADVAPAAPAAPNPTDQRLAAGTQQSPAAATAPAATATAPTTQPASAMVAPGAYRNAPGQYSDNAAGMAMPAGFTGQPSAQNMAAADALQARQSPAGFQPAGSQPAGVQAPVVRNSSNDWAARNNLRNLEVSASSITNQPGFSRGGRGYVPPAAAAYQAALQTDAALQQAQPGADIAAMRENAGIQREGMQQTGANTRTGMQEQGANARDAGRTALARDDFGLRKEAAGFQTRAATRLEGLQTRYEAETDPAKRADIAKQLREIQGKEQPARYKVAAGGQQIDANGVAYRVPDRVFNEQTGQFSDGTGAAPAPQAAPKSGEVRNGFRFKGGNPNDQANWAKV